MQAFLQCLEFQFQQNAVFNKHDVLKFCSEWKKHWDKHLMKNLSHISEK